MNEDPPEVPCQSMRHAKSASARCLVLGMLSLGLLTLGALPTWGAPASSPAPREVTRVRVLADSVPGGQLELEQEPDPDDGSVKRATWYFHPRGRDRQRLGDFRAAMDSISELSASPDGRFLAVLSVGEGHPVLEVFPLPDLLQRRGLTPRLTVNPYPQVINLGGWEGGCLRVASAMLLTRVDQDGRVPGTLDLEDEQVFLLDPASKTFTAVSERARKPEAWFQGRLASAKVDEVTAAASALVTLRATAALPDLRRALAAASDPECRKALQEAISSLESDATPRR